MNKEPRDEMVEHHEGQAIFTARRAIFACVLIAAAGLITVWMVNRNG